MKDSADSEDLKNCFPLSYIQRQLWDYLKIGSDGKGVRNLIKVFQISGEINDLYLEQAWAQVLDSHPILRTRLKTVHGQIYQELLGELTAGIKVIDLSQYEERIAWEKSRELIDQCICNLIDPMQAPLFRILLLKITGSVSKLVSCFHPIIIDWGSSNIIIQNLTKNYNRLKNNDNSEVAEHELDYFAFVKWQQDNIGGDRITLSHQFWKDRFTNFPEVINLPYDFKRTSGSSRFASYISSIDSRYNLNIEKLCKSYSYSPLTVFLTVLSVLLKKYSGQNDICINTSMYERERKEFLKAAGQFEFHIPVQMEMEGELTAMDVFEKAKAALDLAFSNRYLPFQEVLDSTDGIILPLNQVSLSFETEIDEKVSFDGCSSRELNEYGIHSGYDLSFVIKKCGSSFLCQIFHDTSLFSTDTIVRMSRHFITVLENILENPVIKTANIVMLSDEELSTIEQWNKTEMDYPYDESIASLFYKQVEKTPDAIAVLQKNLRVTYYELCQKVEWLCNLLEENHIKTGQKVIVCMERSVESIVSILAIFKTGAVYVPLDLKYPVDRLLFVINDCKADMVITKSGYKEMLSPCGKPMLIIDEHDQKLTVINKGKISQTTPDSPVYIMYTSGSTGVPKGIIGKNRGLINRLFWMWNTYPFSSEEICCHKISISFIDHLAEIFSPLLKGISIVVFNHQVVNGVEDFCNLVIEQKISRLIMTPSSLKLMMKEKREKGLLFKNIKYVFCSGEALPYSLAEDFYNEFSSARLINIYGASEVSADVTYYEVNKFSIKDVLHHFSRFSFNKEEMNRYSNELGHFSDFITKPETDLHDVSRIFNNYRLNESPQEIEQYYNMLYSEVFPFIINTASPKFIGHMTSALPDYLHDLSKLISKLNQNMVKIETSKSLTFLEREALAILHRCFYKYDDVFYEENTQKVNANLGLVTTGGTTSNIGALLSARNKLLFSDCDNVSDLHESIYSIMHKKGYKDMVIIGSPLMHYSMRKASSILGLGLNNIMYVNMNSDNRIDISDLEKKIIKCRKENILILAVVGIAGATETGVIDPLEEMGFIAQKYGVHFHVDAAWGGALVFSEKYKHLLKGISKADTITLCGHKQLFLPQGISICLFKNPFHSNYAATTANYQAVPNTYDFGRFTVEGSRSALSLCLHASLRILGKRGYEVLIDDGIKKARFFSKIISASSAFELIEKPQINILNYRYIPEKFRSGQRNVPLSIEDRKYINTVNEMIQQKQFISGNTFVSKTILKRKIGEVEEDITVFRAVLSNPLTTYDDLYSVLEDQLKLAEILFGERNDYGRGIIKRKLSDKKDNPQIDDLLTIPIGKPIYNTKVYILDSLNNIAPIGITGEICIAGEPVAYGYLNNDGINSGRFIENPYSKAPYDLLYRTGDLGKFLPDGLIKFLGRIDDQVKIRGIRVECGEIESVLCSDPDVVDAAVIGVKFSRDVELVCFYVAQKGAQLNEDKLRAILKSKIPQYMVPSNFIGLDALPVLPNGKIDKKKLKQVVVRNVK